MRHLTTNSPPILVAPANGRNLLGTISWSIFNFESDEVKVCNGPSALNYCGDAVPL